MNPPCSPWRALALLGFVLSCRPAGPDSGGSEPPGESGTASGSPTPSAAPIDATTSGGSPTSSGTSGEPATPGAEGWTAIAQEDGIEVSSHPSSQSPLPIFRGVGVVDAPLLEVLAVVIDAQRHQEWVFSCSDSAMLDQPSEAVGIVYNRTATPWPVPDRDVVLESRLKAEQGDQEIVVRFFATEHPDRPPERGVVRMTYLEGHYHLWAEGPERTRVEYQVDSDPGGRLPPWLATRGTREMPLETLRGLRAQVVRTRGLYDDRIEQLRVAIGDP